MAHIVPWVEVKEHTFENMIVLCSTDHFRYDSKQIPRQSIEIYKANLSMLNGRYGEIERRMLEMFVEGKKLGTNRVELAPGMELHLMYLLRDGIVRNLSPHAIDMWRETGASRPAIYQLTPKGEELIDRLSRGAMLD